MSDNFLPLRSTLIAGMSGTGKTIFALRYLKNAPGVVCRFIFDDLGVGSRYLRVNPATTANQLEAALASRWVLFNPMRMFPGDTDGAGFKFFCRWAFEASKRGPGRKLFFVDELWRFCTPHHIPQEFAILQQTGRVEDVEIVTATQRPTLINGSITGQATEIVCFRLQDSLSVVKVEELSQGRLSRDAIMSLERGNYLGLNTLSGVVQAGKLW